MKNLIYGLLLFGGSITSSSAQIMLETPKPITQQPATTKPSISPKQYNELVKFLVGFGKYNATIVGYAVSCDFAKQDAAIIYNNFYDKIAKSNLSEIDKQNVDKAFTETFQVARQRGVGNSNLTCDTFKPEFTKIINTIKNPVK